MPRLSRTPDLIYATGTDLSLPIGPAVNEREFLGSVRAANLPITAFVPRPKLALPDAAEGENLRFVGRPSTGPLALMVTNQFALLRAVGDELRRATQSGRLPWVIIRLPFLPWSVARLMDRYPQVPFFFKSVGLLGELPTYGGIKQIASRLALGPHNHFAGKVLRAAAGVDTPTPQLVEYLHTTYDLPRENAVCIPNATNVDRFTPSPRHSADNGERTIGYIGGHPYDRGGQQIILCLKQMRETMPHIRGLVVGGDVAPLTALAREAGVLDICQIKDKVPYDQVNAEMGKIDVLLATDVDSRARKYGNSNQKIRQALAMGIPVVTNPYCEALLLEEGVVKGPDMSDIDEVVAVVRAILALPGDDLQALKLRCRQVAVDHLSTRATLHARLDFWHRQSVVFDDGQVPMANG